MKRILAFLTVIALIAVLFAGVPVQADYSLIEVPLPTPGPLDPSTPEPEAEVIAAAGLVDKTAAADIAGGLRSGVTEYKVTNRAGLEKLAEICFGGTHLSGYTFYQTADIDMTWTPFRGIGTSNANDGFRGTYDGNGFVIKNLFISGQTTDRGTGLFNESYNGTFRNIGIASGLILGRNATGAILGHSINRPAIVNCWNAATVISNGNITPGEEFGPAGIVGRTFGDVINCYNLGLIVSTMGTQLGGVSGRQHSGSFVNNYNYGQLVAGYVRMTLWSNHRRAPGFNALLNADADENGSSFTASNNYYRTGCGEFSLKDGLGKICPGETDSSRTIVKSDDGEGKTVSEFTSLASSLNGGDPTAAAGAHADGYTLEYADAENGYPVLTYKSGGTVAVKRLPALNAINIGAALDFTDSASVYYSPFFTAMKARAATEATSIDTGFIVAADITANATVHNAMDLLLLAAFTNSNSRVVRDITLASDIDCSLNPITGWLPPLFYNTELYAGCTFNGGDHAISNLQMNLTVDARSASHAGLFAALGAGCVLRDLEIAGGTVAVKYTNASADYAVGVLAGYAAAGASISRCRTGAALAMTGSTNTEARVSAICADGADTVTIDNCWNSGAITGVTGGRVGVLSDASCTVNVYNSFNAGAVTGAATRRLVTGTAGTESLFSNLWDASGTLTAVTDHNANASTGDYFDEMIASPLEESSYSDGRLAYELNNGWVSGKGARQYYTVTGGRTVYGTAANAPYRITFLSDGDTVGERFTGSEGTLLSAAPTRIPLRPLIGWRNGGGSTVDPDTAVFTGDTILYAIAGPADTVSASLRDVIELKMILDLDYYGNEVRSVTVTGPDSEGENGAAPISRTYTRGTDLLPGTDGRYPIAWPVAAAQMTDPITISVTYVNDETAVILPGYTVKQYLDTIYSAVSDPLLVSLCGAALQYGACAQEAFGYKTETLAAAITTVLDPTVLDSAIYNNVATGTRAAVGLSKVSTSALIRDRVALRMYITLADGSAIEDYTFSYVRSNGEPAAITPAATETPGKYALNITGIVAADFGVDYTFTVRNTRLGTVYSLKTGVLNYGKKVLTSSTVTDEMKRLVCAMKAYNDAALKYFYAPLSPNEMPEMEDGDE